MDTMNGVVNKATGLLLRCGYCDFTISPDFKPDIEEQHGDVPYPPNLFRTRTKNPPFSETITHWTGNGWDEVPRIEFVPPGK